MNGVNVELGSRLLLVASELPPVYSGVARSADRVRRGLEARGWHVDTLSNADAPVRHVGEFRFPLLARHFIRMGRLLADYDVVHLHGPAPFISELFLARAATVRGCPPVLYTHHFSVVVDEVAPLCRLYNLTQESIATVADAVVVTTPTYRDKLERGVRRLGGTTPVEVVPWGVDADRFAYPHRVAFDGDRALRVLYAGQLRPYKGVMVALDAMDVLAERSRGRNPRVDLRIIGGGPLEGRVRSRTEGRGDVCFLGSVDDDELISEMQAADVILLPSVNELEAFGMVLLEGMSAGCVPVTTDVAGLGDVVGEAGLIVPADHPGALASTLARLSESPDLVASLSALAVQRARTFDWDDTVAAYDRCLRALVATHSRRTGAAGPTPGGTAAVGRAR